MKPGRKCKTCSHPKRAKIEALIIDSKTPILSISRRFNVSRGALTAHRDKCMRPAVEELISRTEAQTIAQTHATVLRVNRAVASIHDFIERIDDQYSTLSGILAEATAQGEERDPRLALGAIREMRETLRFYLDLFRESRISEQESKKDMSQKFDATMKAVMEALAEHPEALAAVVARLDEVGDAQDG